MHRIVAMIFAGGRVPELGVLTERRAKAAVVFGGAYRTIDFALTNLADAGIGQVGILAQYRPSSLMDHVGSGMAWDLVGTDRTVRFLPPYLGPGAGEWYRGPADALYQNIDFIQRHAPEHVLVVSGDHVSKMDYRPLLDFHRERDADLTMAFKPMEEDPSRYGIGEINAVGQIMNFVEKPEYPRTNLASIGVYLFKRQVLLDELSTAVAGREGATFEIHEILHRMIPRRRAYGYVFHGEWHYTRTLDEYVAFHHKLLGPDPAVDLNLWDVRSNVMARRSHPAPPARVLPGGVVENSLVCPGCVIEGTVRNSVLSRGVHVQKDAVVDDCVLWEDVVVETAAQLSGVVSDKRVHFGPGCQVGRGESIPSTEMRGSLTCGASVFGMDVRVPAGARIGRNCVVHADARGEDFAGEVASGSSVKRTEVTR
ncbi:MAG: sugar phosphate nucleotidyltransferase [Pseudomonadota bacterium]